jgi:hypothetical protein
VAAELFGECRLSCTERTSRGSCGKEGRARGTDQAPFELAGAWHQSRRSLRYVTLLIAIAGQQEEGFWQQRAYTYCFLWERGTDDDTDRRPAGIAAAKLFRQRPQSISDDPVERRAVDFEILECTCTRIARPQDSENAFAELLAEPQVGLDRIEAHTGIDCQGIDRIRAVQREIGLCVGIRRRGNVPALRIEQNKATASMGIGASRSSSAMPAEPNRSYMALCGLKAATRSTAWSITATRKSSIVLIVAEEPAFMSPRRNADGIMERCGSSPRQKQWPRFLDRSITASPKRKLFIFPVRAGASFIGSHPSTSLRCLFPLEIDAAIEIELEATVGIDVTVDQRCETAIVFRRQVRCPFRLAQHRLHHPGVYIDQRRLQ